MSLFKEGVCAFVVTMLVRLFSSRMRLRMRGASGVPRALIKGEAM